MKAAPKEEELVRRPELAFKAVDLVSDVQWGYLEEEKGRAGVEDLGFGWGTNCEEGIRVISYTALDYTDMRDTTILYLI